MVDLSEIEKEHENVDLNGMREDENSGDEETSEDEEQLNEVEDEQSKNDGENESNAKQKNNARNSEQDYQSSNKDLLTYFWKLADLNETTRCEAVVGLITELKKTNGNKEDINYALQRLIKGLSSSRKAARQGFATALTHVLNNFDIDSQQVLDLMSKHLAVQGSFKGPEEADAYFGQVFGLMAICRSKIKIGLNKDVDLVKKLTQNLLILMKKKSFLGEVCATAICESILRNISYATFQDIESIFKEQLTKGFKGCAPEDFMIALTVQLVFKDDLAVDYFKPNWNHSNLVDENNFKELCTILLDTTNTSHPRVHSLWDLILNVLFSSDLKDSNTFENFWRIVVEEGLLQSTHERKYLAMNLLLKVAPKVPASKIHVVFSPNIVRCIINNSQSKMNYLFSAVKTLLKELPEKLAENRDVEVFSCIVKCLVGSYGHVAFDSITKSKTVEEITSKLFGDLKAHFDWLRKVFRKGSTNLDAKNKDVDEKDVNECHSFVADQLLILLKVCKSQNEESILSNITHFLFYHAYFVPLKPCSSEVFLKKLPVHPVSDETRQIFKLKFNTALKELANFYVKSEKEQKNIIGGIASDGELYTWKVLHFAKNLLEMPEHTQLVTAWTPDVYDCWQSSLGRIKELMLEGKDEAGAVTITDGTILLLSHIALQLFSLCEEAVDTMNDLTSCFDKAKEKTKKKKAEPHWTEVLSEILLGFMAQGSHLLRQVVDIVFPTIVPHVTEEALNILLDALKPSRKGEEGGVEFEDESDIEEDMTGDGDNEVERDENEVQHESNDGDSGDDDADDTDDTDDDEMEIDEDFKIELKAALGKFAGSEDESTDDDNGREEEDIDMDTCSAEELKAMDQALANVFKARKQKQIEKKKEKDKKFSVVHFKLRVLDLIEIYIKKCHTDKKILVLIEPLYDVIISSNMKSEEQPLFERTAGLIKNKLCSLHAYPSGEDLDVDAVHSQIERLVELAKSATSALMVDYITQGVVYLIRVLRGNPDVKKPSPRRTRSKKKKKEPLESTVVNSNGCLNEERLLSCYQTALAEFYTKKSSHLQPVFFYQLVQRFPNIGWNLAKDIPKYINDGCNNFRKLKAVEMLKLLFSNKGDNFETSLQDIHKEMSDNIIRAFKATNMEGFNLKARQFRDIVQLTDLFVKCASKFSSIDSKLDKCGIKKSLEEAQESHVISKSSPLQIHCKKIINTLDTSSQVKKKKSTKRKKSN